MANLPRLKRGEKLLIATHNAGKLAEFRELFTPLGLVLISAGDLGLPEPDETGTTFAENARIKAHAAASRRRHASRWPTIPGFRSMPSAASPASIPPTGPRPPMAATTASACAASRIALQAAGATTPGLRKGAFNATLCLAHPDGRDDLYVGKVTGTLVWPPRGDLGHGFDPVFMPDGFDITFGEMPSATKHGWAPGQTGLSHRARAFGSFVEDAIEHS